MLKGGNLTNNIALEHGRADVLEVLIEEGGWPEGLFRHGIAWNLRMNLCPETEEDFPQISEFKRLLNARSEALKVFARHCGEFPGFNKEEYTSASFFSLDYNPDLLQYFQDLSEREVNAFFEVSLAHGEGAPAERCKPIWLQLMAVSRVQGNVRLQAEYARRSAQRDYQVSQRKGHTGKGPRPVRQSLVGIA